MRCHCCMRKFDSESWSEVICQSCLNVDPVRDAAPDMLAALKEIKEWNRNDWAGYTRLDEILDEAISKAEGKE